MGAWGPAIFSDDTACDVRDSYRELLEDGVDDSEAEQRVIEEYADLGDDESHVMWLALASAQHSLGRLSDRVRARAVGMIDEGIGLALWEEAGPKELAKRREALAKVRAKLVGPEVARKKVRRPWFHVTDLVAGDVLAYQLPSGAHALFRVARIDEHRVGTAPILRRLEWDKAKLPSAWRLQRLRPLCDPSRSTSAPMASLRVAKLRKRDQDWNEVGFEIVGRVSPASGDASHEPRVYTAWTALREGLDNGWV